MIVKKLCRPKMQGFLRIVIPLLLISISYLLLNLYDPTFLNSIIQTIKHHPTEYLLYRWSALCAFIACWPSIVLKIGQLRSATPEQISHWRKETWRIGLWLIIIELLLCENLIHKTIELIKGL